MTSRKEPPGPPEPAGPAGPREQAIPPADDVLPDHIARWLEMVTRRLRADLMARGMRDFPELRGSHRRILQMIPPQGIRITDLALLAGMTKQALGEFVDWLEEARFVSSGRDPADGRVRLVKRTDNGDAAAAAAQRAIEAVEQAWRAELGADRYDTMKQAMRELGSAADPTRTAAQPG
jgi:DNA-binding MarR family transcriptional regulator